MVSPVQRFGRWCRTHPRCAAIGLAVFAVLAIIGSLTSPDKKAPKDASRLNYGPSTLAFSPSSSEQVPSSAPITTPTPTTSGQESAAPVDHQQRSHQLATAVLATLAVKGRAPKTGYTRTQFGTAWTDDNDDPDGHNGCDTRNDVLRRDLTNVTLKPGSNGCTVLAGTLRDPYTATTIHFRRGPESARVQIDHVVALSDAWQKGAQRYSEQTRTNLANDPLNLLAVDGPTNGAKGDGDAATWLPPNKAYRCAYVARQIAVKARYRLWMTPAEKAASARVLSTCPNQTVPAESDTAVIHEAPKPTPRRKATHKPTPAPPPAPTQDDVYYENCAAVRAAGKAPLYRGQPGYDSHLDRDDDGVACES